MAKRLYSYAVGSMIDDETQEAVIVSSRTETEANSSHDAADPEP